VGRGALDLAPSLATNSATFYAATVAPGAVDLAPARFNNSASFYSATVAPGAATIAPSLVANEQSFHAATAAPGAVSVAPTRYDNASVVYDATLEAAGEAQDLAVGITTNTASFYSPAVSSTYTLSAELVEGAAVFYGPTVEIGDPHLWADLLVNETEFYSASVYRAAFGSRTGRSDESDNRPAVMQTGTRSNAQGGGRSNIQNGSRSNVQTARR
jgi:hypothetical protein